MRNGEGDGGLARRLARDHWVRLHGTPRVTVLVGGARARSLWTTWIALSQVEGTLLEGDIDFDAAMRTAMARTGSAPSEPIAVVASASTIEQWWPRAGDRARAMVSEGRLVVPDVASSAAECIAGTRTNSDVPVTNADAVGAASAALLDARSVAEAMLFEALEATSATRGRFELNGRLSVFFGSDAAEVDLLGREDRIAIEIDGYHHFADADGYRRDRRKDVLLQTQGLLVVRLLAEDVTRDPREAVNTVCRALAYRLGER